MKDLMQKVKSFMTFDLPLQATYISTNFAETHQKLKLEVPEWSTTATRQQLISNYWFNHVTAHFAFIFGLPALVIFFLSGGLHDFSGYLATIMIAGIICYLVLHMFHYHPTFCTTYLPRLETAKDEFDGKQTLLTEKCRQAQLSNLALTLVWLGNCGIKSCSGCIWRC